jgi:hypothetical protein
VVMNMRQTTWMILVLMVAALGMSACGGGAATTKADQAAPAVQEPSAYEHTVRWSGETLSIIAKWYTGDARNWSILARENPSLSRNKLKIGATVKIPRNILTNSEPLPRSAIPQAAKPKRPPGAKGMSPRKGAPPAVSSDEAEAAEVPDVPARPQVDAPVQPQQDTPAQPRKDNLDLFGPKE